jgi:hypothetical protein
MGCVQDDEKDTSGLLVILVRLKRLRKIGHSELGTCNKNCTSEGRCALLWTDSLQDRPTFARALWVCRREGLRATSGVGSDDTLLVDEEMRRHGAGELPWCIYS